MNTATSTATEAALSPADKQQAELFFDQALKGVVGAIKCMSPAQWNFSPEPNCWSPALIVDHLMFVWERVLNDRKAQLAQLPPPPAGIDTKMIDTVVMSQFSLRLNKFPSPEMALPKGRFQSVAEAQTALANLRPAAAAYLDTPELRLHAAEAPPLRLVTNGAYTVLDGYQWFLAASAHAVRHTKQILEVKADANYPEN